MSEELKDIIDKIKEQGKMNFLDAASEEQILVFEQEHEMKFPEQYKEWLLFSDGGELFLPAGIQFYGIQQKPVIDVNNNDRPDDNYIVIGALSTGDPIVFRKGSEEIAIYNHEDDCIEEDEQYKDLYSFLNDLSDIVGIGE